jgi:hypothetical protein
MQILGAQDTVRAPSPLLLKRLAEALDGYRTGQKVYLVASYDYPNTVAGIYASRPEAEASVRALGQHYAAFGPYQSIRDRDSSPRMFMCKHVNSALEPRRYCPTPPGWENVAMSDVDSIYITVRLKNGDRRQEVLPKGTDAVFFTLSAVDKFALPYYAHAVGMEETVRMRQEILATPRR